MSELIHDPMVLRQIIMDHYEYPRNHELSEEEGYVSKHMASASCIDDIYVQAKLKDNVIEDIRFDGVACTISTASTSIMSELLQGKTTSEAKKIIDAYYAMINNEPYDDELLQVAVGKQANRIKCATIGWEAMKQIIEDGEAHEQ